MTTAQHDHVLDLTTEVVPAKLFTIDGEEYELYTFDHLSPDAEATVTGTFSRFQRTYQDLEKARDDNAASRVAKKLRSYRVRIITTMTNVPEEVVDKLGSTQQGQILRAIQEEIADETLTGGGDDDSESDD